LFHFIPDDKFFGYFLLCLCEAIETLVYCYDIAQARSFGRLMQDFGGSEGVYYDPTIDRFPRYLQDGNRLGQDQSNEPGNGVVWPARLRGLRCA
jgi:hypothetical protein